MALRNVGPKAFREVFQSSSGLGGYPSPTLLAYVTGSRPRGSIGSPPERGAEAYAAWSGHMSAPDPRLALIKA
jgi:hypothetical protein